MNTQTSLSQYIVIRLFKGDNLLLLDRYVKYSTIINNVFGY